jgi:hypothetical protein
MCYYHNLGLATDEGKTKYLHSKLKKATELNTFKLRKTNDG